MQNTSVGIHVYFEQKSMLSTSQLPTRTIFSLPELSIQNIDHLSSELSRTSYSFLPSMEIHGQVRTAATIKSPQNLSRGRHSCILKSWLLIWFWHEIEDGCLRGLLIGYALLCQLFEHTEGQKRPNNGIGADDPNINPLGTQLTLQKSPLWSIFVNLNFERFSSEIKKWEIDLLLLEYVSPDQVCGSMSWGALFKKCNEKIPVLNNTLFNSPAYIY